MPKGSSLSSASGKQLLEASESGNLIAVRKLLDEGVDVNWKNKKRDTALCWASAKGHAETSSCFLTGVLK